MKNLNFILLFLFFLTSCFSGDHGRVPSGDEHYDEIIDESGNVRPEYRGVYEVYQNFDEQKREKFAKGSLRDFKKDNELLPVPRIISNETYTDVKKGVAQRGKAIQKFLKDHYSGQKKYLRDGVIPAQVIESILKRSGDDVWQGHVKPEHINFWYGPDIIRDPRGNFKVVEDNPGFIGGMGDLIKARESLYKRAPEYEGIVDSPDPQAFYTKLAEEYKKRAEKFGGVPVVVQYTSSLAADNEDTRVKEIFKSLGVETVFINPDRKTRVDQNRIVAGRDRVWLEATNANGVKRRRKVGYVVANMETHDIDPNHELFRKKILLTEGSHYELTKREQKKLQSIINPVEGEVDFVKLESYLINGLGLTHLKNKERGVPGLMQMVLDGKVGMSYAPGLEFIGDKEFYIYVDDLVRYYLKEEPVLTNMETGSFAKYSQDSARLNHQKFNRVFNNIDSYVIKGVDGRGGDAVWVGPKVSAEELEKVKEMISENPAKFIFQKYTPLSVLDNHIVDLRIISDVGPRKVIVADVPWGRAVPMSGDGKVNISAQGSETTVLVRRNMNCANIVLDF